VPLYCNSQFYAVQEECVMNCDTNSTFRVHYKSFNAGYDSQIHVKNVLDRSRHSSSHLLFFLHLNTRING
jgi:hypothetical protein